MKAEDEMTFQRGQNLGPPTLGRRWGRASWRSISQRGAASYALWLILIFSFQCTIALMVYLEAIDFTMLG